MSEFSLLIVCLVVGLVNIFLTLTVLACLAFLFPTPTKAMAIFRKVILAVSVVLIIVIAFFVWYYAFSLPIK
jgi:drug/metabolite transporter (DMT)-like permease